MYKTPFGKFSHIYTYIMIDVHIVIVFTKYNLINNYYSNVNINHEILEKGLASSAYKTGSSLKANEVITAMMNIPQLLDLPLCTGTILLPLILFKVNNNLHDSQSNMLKAVSYTFN